MRKKVRTAIANFGIADAVQNRMPMFLRIILSLSQIMVSSDLHGIFNTS